MPSGRPALRQKSGSPPHPGVLPETPAGPEEEKAPKKFEINLFTSQGTKGEVTKEDIDGLD